MTIILLAEGATEKALGRKLKMFLDERATQGGHPKVAFRTKDIMSLNEGVLRGRIRRELNSQSVTGVIGLIDVYPDFKSAIEAKDFLRKAAENNPRFYAHAAQYDVEAWLLPYWDIICKRVGFVEKTPGLYPEQVNRDNPPSKRLATLYRRAKPRPKKYIKPIEMDRILQKQDLMIAANQCPELKALLNTLLKLAGLSDL